VLATRPCRCSCPCAVAHGGPLAPKVVCRGTMPTGSAVGVTILDGEQIAVRCLPCALASGWRAETPMPMVMAETAAEVAL
jgi:hypothetical protein